VAQITGELDTAFEAGRGARTVTAAAARTLASTRQSGQAIQPRVGSST